MKKSFVWPALSTFVDCSSFSGITPPKFWYLNQTNKTRLWENLDVSSGVCFLGAIRRRSLCEWSAAQFVHNTIITSIILQLLKGQLKFFLLYSANYFYIVLSQRCIYASRTTICLTFVLPCLASCLRLLQQRSMEATDTIASSGLYQRSYRVFFFVLRSVSSPVAFIAATCN